MQLTGIFFCYGIIIIALLVKIIIAHVTKEFISKTTFLSFHGLTGESRKALDAQLRTSGMTYKDVVCADTNDRISKLTTCFFDRKVIY
jgi:hypothetical protein